MIHLRAIYWFKKKPKSLTSLLAEVVETGPMGVHICSLWSLDQDQVKIMTKMSSLMKSQIIDYELLVCEYGLRAKGLHVPRWYSQNSVWSKSREFSCGFLSQVWILQVLGLSRGFLPHTRMEEQPWFLFTFSTLIILYLRGKNDCCTYPKRRQYKHKFPTTSSRKR